MIYFIQLLRLLDKQNRDKLANLLNDLSFEVEELGYEGMESELVSELLLSHFGLKFEDSSQLEMLTQWVLSNQGKLVKRVETIEKLFKVA